MARFARAGPASPLSTARLGNLRAGSAPLSTVRLGAPNAPTVTLLHPTAGDLLWVGEASTFRATVAPGDGTVVEARFSEDMADLGAASLVGGEYQLSVTPAVAGDFAYRAYGVNSFGKAAYSSPETVTVMPGALEYLQSLNPLGLWLVGDGSPTYVRIDSGNARAGDQLDRIWDLGGAGNDLIQDTDNRQPDLVSIGTRSGAQFYYTPVQQNMLTAGRLWDNLAAFTLVQIWKARSTELRYLTTDVGSNGNAYMASSWRDNPNWYQYVGGSSFGTGYGVLSITNDLALHGYSTRFYGAGVGNAQRLRLWEDTVEETPGFVGTIGATTDGTAGELGIGALNNPCQGTFAGAVLLPAAYNDATMNLIHICMRRLVPDWVA